MNVNWDNKGILFEPWIGQDYENGLHGKRVWILGESHYGTDDGWPPPRLWTIECIRQVLAGKPNSPFWRSIAKTVLGEKSTELEQDEFWHRVAFSNYVQAIAAEEARQPPTREMYASAEQPFFEVLNALEPDLLLTFCARMWDRLPDVPKADYGPDIPGRDGVRMATCRYTAQSGRKVLACRLLHPSGGLSPKRWHSAVAAAFDA